MINQHRNTIFKILESNRVVVEQVIRNRKHQSTADVKVGNDSFFVIDYHLNIPD